MIHMLKGRRTVRVAHLSLPPVTCCFHVIVSLSVSYGGSCERERQWSCFVCDQMWVREQVRASVNQKLEETGEKEKLKELLRKKLIERGWRDELKEYCKEVIPRVCL